MAKEKEEEKKEEGAAEAPKPKSKKKLFIIIGVVLLLVGAGVPFALMGGKEAPKEGEEHAAKEEERHLVPIKMDTIVVNLSENASFLKVKMTLEYDPEILSRALTGGEGGGHGGGGAGGGGDGGLPPGLAEKEAQIRDALISTLSSKTPAEVLTIEGKEQLKEDLIEAVNEAIGFEEGPIVNIFFNDFLVQ